MTMAKVRLSTNDLVWVIDTYAPNVAARSIHDKNMRNMVQQAIVQQWKTGKEPFRVTLLPFSSYHRWIRVHAFGHVLYAKDTEVVRA